MEPPEGYSLPQPGQVCHLKKSLYGLKQASRQWNAEFCAKLVGFGFLQSQNDHCLFIKSTSTSFMALIIYVDDVLVTGSDPSDIEVLKSYLHKMFTIKDLGHAKYFLGLEIARSPAGTYVHQRKYILDILKDEGTPLPDSNTYRRLVGRLLYLNMSRPDVTHAIQQLSQFINDPYSTHWDAAVHVLRYLKGTPSKGLFYAAEDVYDFEAYCDADWATCLDSRRSLTGYCVYFGGALVSWRTKKQVTVSKSSAEAEYRSMSQTVCELLWLSYLATDLHRTKHVEIDCHIVRNKYKDGFVLPHKVSTKLQLADVFTKSLGPGVFGFLLSKLGMQDFLCLPA
ncbi:hypothetical protein DH2020_046215 [Rehmannia glutinosa]|uniref:Reverse transcriptase Ty1/copia-type domain-containing protein n=1 Tax=Rehmannia glutinosa TaxID=99300 RepID=A0ABR0UD28_REHGL